MYIQNIGLFSHGNILCTSKQNFTLDYQPSGGSDPKSNDANENARVWFYFCL